MRLDLPGVEGNIDIYMRVLRAICGDTAGKSMVDLCCAFAPNTPKLGFPNRMYFDVINRTLDHPGEQQFFIQYDVLRLPNINIHPIKFDVSICSDGIEHFKESDGIKLLSIMEQMSYNQIIFTPLGELWMEKTPSQDPEAHRSAWYPEMLPGYASIVFPDYHKSWGVGAFFSWKCKDIEKDFERVKNLIQL